MKNDTVEKLSATTVTLHWLVGLIVLGLLTSGVSMVEGEIYALYPWHKSVGVVALLFICLRIAWRCRNGWLQPVAQYSPLERHAARTTHHLLLWGVLLMPLSGLLMSGMAGYGVELFGLELIASNPDPAEPGAVIAFDSGLANFASAVHSYAGYLLIAVVSLHLLGALKHHFIDRDATLRRMLGRSR